MEMKQMVYVVIENDGLTGVWNEYKDAENHVSEDGVIIPVVVDQYGHRDGCETPSEVVTAMEKELQNLYSSCSDSDDDEEEDNDMFSSFFDEDDEDEEEDDDEEEDEDDDEDDDDEDDDDEANDIIRGLLNMLFN